MGHGPLGGDNFGDGQEERASPFDKRCADALADEVAVLIRRGVIDARSPAGDALLDYRDPPPSPRADRLAAVEAERERLERDLRVARASSEHLDSCSNETGRRLKAAGFERGQLQAQYRVQNPPPFDYQRVELALLDALREGGVIGWSGDGLGMATQIAGAYASDRDRLKDALHDVIEVLERPAHWEERVLKAAEIVRAALSSPRATK